MGECFYLPTGKYEYVTKLLSFTSFKTKLRALLTMSNLLSLIRRLLYEFMI